MSLPFCCLLSIPSVAVCQCLHIQYVHISVRTLLRMYVHIVCFWGRGDASDAFVCMSLYLCVCNRILCVDCYVVYILYLISCILFVARCVLAVNKGLLALKVENVNKIWIAQVALFDSLQVSSSPWLRPFSLPTGMGGADEIYDIEFEQSNTAGLTPGSRLPTQQDTLVQCVHLVHVLVSAHL